MQTLKLKNNFIKYCKNEIPHVFNTNFGLQKRGNHEKNRSVLSYRKMEVKTFSYQPNVHTPSYLIFIYLLGISFNQPKFSSCAVWNTNATTFANRSSIGQQPTDIFINTQNNIYVSDRENNHILIWYNGSFTLNKTISGNLISPWSLFVADNGDIYVDNGHFHGRVDRWSLDSANNQSVMLVNSPCTGLFIDTLGSLYCSSTNEHRVFRLGFNSNTTVPMIVGGTGCPGPVSNMLDHPYGIFVDKNFNLLVADSHNNRIQRFTPGQLEAITVAGFGAIVTFILNRPTSVVLDGDDHLFIVDSGNHRIIRSISNGFQCLFGCSGHSGATPSQLNNPQRMAFDRDGNIFVIDLNNHRVQKFNLVQNSCGTYVHLKVG
jgi:DNA-binding beta-propeller fold protein YncE